MAINNMLFKFLKKMHKNDYENTRAVKIKSKDVATLLSWLES